MASVTVLGSGTVDPQPHRASSGFWLEMGGRSLVLDLGYATLRNALLANLDITSLETLVLTHLHPDHSADLVPFLFARKYAPESWQKSPPLRVYGPLGCQDFFEKLYLTWPSLRHDEERLRVVEVEPEKGPISLYEDVTLHAFTALHGDMTALCYRFEGEGKAIAFSGDTALCEGVLDVARGADLFLCECSCYPRGVEPLQCRQVHLAWEDVAEICQISQPRSLVLTHLYEVVLARRPSPEESLREALSIPVQSASDLAVYQV